MYVTFELNVNKQLAIEWTKRGGFGYNIDHDRNNPDEIESNKPAFLKQATCKNHLSYFMRLLYSDLTTL